MVVSEIQKTIQELSDIILDVTRCGSGKLNFGKK
jgi:hypothetical protein